MDQIKPYSHGTEFEIEMRTALAKLSAQQNELTTDLRDYLHKTVSHEVEMSKTRSEIDTLFHNYKELRQELRENREDIGKIIDDKIESIYKMTSITAFIVSTIVALIGIAVTVNMH